MTETTDPTQAMFLVEGTLREVQHARTTVNLLAQVERRLSAKAVASGVAAAVSGMHGVLANSAMLAMYDGEDTFNFAALLGDQVVCGNFESGDEFRDGDPVKLAVSRRGGVLLVHALLRESDGMLFMPLNVYRGPRALLRQCLGHALSMCRWAWIVMGLLLFFFARGTPLAEDHDKLVFLGLLVALIPPLFLLPMEYWTYRSFRASGERAAEIFRLFGFPNPDSVDLTPHLTTARASGDEYRNVKAFDYRKAIVSR